MKFLLALLVLVMAFNVHPANRVWNLSAEDGKMLYMPQVVDPVVNADYIQIFARADGNFYKMDTLGVVDTLGGGGAGVSKWVLGDSYIADQVAWDALDHNIYLCTVDDLVSPTAPSLNPANWLQLSAELNAGMFKVDQATPQTVTNGRPVFAEGLRLGLTPAAVAHGEGSIYFDPKFRTAVVDVNGGVSLQIGQEEVRMVYNATASTLLNGKAVYVTGVYNGGTNDVSTVGYAIANDVAKFDVMGVTTEDILPSTYGFITTRGNINDINTTAVSSAAGDTLWLSDSVAGDLTYIKPSQPSYAVKIGQVITRDLTVGRMNVGVFPIHRIEDISDTVITSPAVNDVLKFNGVNWINGTQSTSAGQSSNYFLTDTASGIGAYDNLSKIAEAGVEVVDSLTINANGVEQLIDSYITAELGSTSIEGGAWSFELWRYVNSGAGVTQVVIRVYKRTSGAVETELFNVTTGEINDTTNTLQSIKTVRGSFVINPTDRMVVKLYGITTAQPKTVNFSHNGTARNTYIVTPIVVRHNNLAGINEGDIQHLSAAQKTVATTAATVTNDGYATTSQINALYNGATGMTGQILLNASFEVWNALATTTSGWSDIATSTISRQAQIYQSLVNSYYVRSIADAASDGIFQRITSWPEAASGTSVAICNYSFRYKQGTNHSFLIWNGAVYLANVPLTASTDWKWVNGTFSCPTKASTWDISFQSTGAGTIDVDDVFVGYGNSKVQIDQAWHEVTGRIVPTTNCIWSLTNTVFASFPDDADCPAATITTSSTTKGTWTGVAQRPQLSVTNMPVGICNVKAKFPAYSSSVTTVSMAFKLTDGTGSSTVGTGTNSSIYTDVLLEWQYTSTGGSKLFTIQGAVSSGSVNIANDGFERAINWEVDCFPSQPSASTVDLSQAGMDDYGVLTYAQVNALAGNQGFGTFVSGNMEYIREGKHLRYRGSLEVGTPTGSEARLPLPNSLLTDTNSLQSQRKIGDYTVDATATTHGGFALATSGKGYVTFGQVGTYSNTSVNPFSATTGANIVTAGQVMKFDILVPIQGWKTGSAYIINTGYTDKQYDLTVTGTGWTTTRAVGVPYQTINGVWRMKFNMYGTIASGTRSGLSVNVTGVVSAYAQAISALTDNASLSFYRAYSGASTNLLDFSHASGTTTTYFYSGDIELASKPSFVP